MENNEPENVENIQNLESADTSTAPQPRVNLEQLARIEEELLEKMEKRADAKKLERQADAEMAKAEGSGIDDIEKVLFMIGAGLMILSLPFIHYLLAIVLTLFTILIALIAGLTSSTQPGSYLLNLATSLIALIFFEFSAIYVHGTGGNDSGFYLYQALALIFLFCTFFSARTYRKKILEGEA